MKPMAAARLEEYTRGAVAILRRSIELYDQGERVFYRVMAVELRLLLCDTTRRHDRIIDLALIPRLRSDLRLPLPEPGGLEQQHPLALADWLEHELPLTGVRGQPVTIRQLIRQVCDQDGGAHVDQRVNSGLPADAGQAEWIRAVAGVVVEALGEQ